jgi:hypothetical protein
MTVPMIDKEKKISNPTRPAHGAATTEVDGDGDARAL